MENQEISVEALCASEHFQKYCLQPEETDINYWEQWLKDHPDQLDTFQEAKRLVQQLSFQLPEEEIQEEFSRLSTQLESKPQAPNRQLWPRRHILQIAAAVLILVIGLWVWNEFSAPTNIQLATPYGKTQEFVLPDSSKVTLNANSKLHFLSNWDKSNKREVWLDGEAYFEVIHQTEKPFVVHTQKGNVNVLGTSFNVFQRSEAFNVALVEGKVELAFPNKMKINMKPGEQVVLKQNTIEQSTVDVEAITAWRAGKLIFENATIKNIIERLQQEYGWEIRVKNESLLKRKVKAKGLKNNPELLLEALSEIYEIEIHKVSEGVYEIE